MIKTKTQTVNPAHFPEKGTFFGLEIRQLEAEQMAFQFILLLLMEEAPRTGLPAGNPI